VGWDVFVEKGSTGSTGDTGATGPRGNTGATGPVGDYVISVNGFTGTVDLKPFIIAMSVAL
jgi:hypothetical protein